VKLEIMMDIETLGNSSNAVITQIGAVAFNVEQGIVDQYHMRINPESCQEIGLTMDVSTVLWWLKQSDAARAEFDKGPQISIQAALDGFSEFCKRNMTKESGVWGNGATFDNVIVGNAYKRAGKPQPWMFWQDRCYRTFKQLLKQIPPDEYGVAHNGLDDAIKQAMHLIKICKTTGLVL
jgi:hypothetical protein